MSEWQPIETYKKDGQLVFLLVEQAGGSSSNPTEDEIEYRTIGHNNFENDGDDRWLFAGWNWENDYFTEGRGKPVAWQQLPSA